MAKRKNVYDTRRGAHYYTGKTPSETFDWDRAIKQLKKMFEQLDLEKP